MLLKLLLIVIPVWSYIVRIVLSAEHTIVFSALDHVRI